MASAGQGLNLDFSFFLAVGPVCGFTTCGIETCGRADHQGLKN
jgi:hypothetical protein